MWLPAARLVGATPLSGIAMPFPSMGRSIPGPWGFEEVDVLVARVRTGGGRTRLNLPRTAFTPPLAVLFWR